MKWIIIMLLNSIIQKSKKEQIKLMKKGGGSVIVAQAYDNMIKNYKDTIMFLKAQQKSQ